VDRLDEMSLGLDETPDEWFRLNGEVGWIYKTDQIHGTNGSAR